MLTKNHLNQAVTILRQGGLVAMPTETVYGLAADARNPEALRKIFQAKQRPIDHPLIVHIGDLSQLSKWAVDISDSALLLAKTFWPGPLTLILKKAPTVLDLVTGHQDTIGLRIPNHPVALQLLNAFGGGLAAPSANRFGRISPTTSDAVREELGASVDLILEGGPCEVGVESTIIDMSGTKPQILRPGMITREQVESILHQTIDTTNKNTLRVSGALESHYAPQTKTRLIEREELKLFLQNHSALSIGVVAIHTTPPHSMNNRVWIKMPNNATEYAHDIYQVLRELDKKGLQQILIENIPENVQWCAIRDRLNKATFSR